MGDFELAAKQCGFPRCPHCGELRALEKLNSVVWLCVVCAKQFQMKDVMKRIAVAVILTLFASLSAQAQVGTEPLAWQPEHRALADGISTALVGVQAGGTIWRDVTAWKDGDHTPTYRSACSIGIAMALTETLKHAFPEIRPDGSDIKSWPSGHAAATAALSGWRLEIGIPISVMTGLFRDAANKHHIWVPVDRKVPDIPMGWAIGAGAQVLCSALIR